MWESLKKLVFVGFLSLPMIGPGSTGQLIAAFVFAVVCLMLQMQARPYKRDEDDFLATACAFCLVLMFFFCLILQQGVLIDDSRDTLTQQVRDRFEINTSALGFGMIVVVLLSLFLAFIMMTFHAAKARQEAKKQRELEAQLQQFLEQEAPTDKEVKVLEEFGSMLPAALQDKQIPLDQLTIGASARIAAGAFGEVFKAEYRGEMVAVKRLARARLADKNMLENFTEEGALLASLHHRNIIGLLGGCWSVENASVCLVMELCEAGSLQGFVEDDTAPFPWATMRVPVARDVARAMTYLHSLTPLVLHRDIKPANVLLAHDPKTRRSVGKLCDFGESRAAAGANAKTMTTVGTPLYAAPEVMRRDHYDELCDVWSFGVMLHALATRRQPYSECGQSLDEALRLVQDERLAPSLVAASPFYAVVERCVAFNPEERPPFETVLEMLYAPNLDTEAAGDGSLRQLDAQGEPSSSSAASADATDATAGLSRSSAGRASGGESAKRVGITQREASRMQLLDQLPRRNSLTAPPEGETKAEMLARRHAALDDGTSPEELRTKTRPKRESVLLDKKAARASTAPGRCSFGAAATIAEDGTTQRRSSSVQTLRSRVHRLSLLVRKLPAPTEETLNAHSEGRPGDVRQQSSGWDSTCLSAATAAAPSAPQPSRTPETVCVSTATLDALVEQSHAQNVDLSV